MLKLYILEKDNRLKESKLVEKDIYTSIFSASNERDKAYLLFYLGGVYYMQNKITAAIGQSLKANAILEKIDTNRLRILNLQNLGLYFSTAQMFKKAIEYLKKADPLIRRSGHQDFTTFFIYYMLGFYSIRLKEFKEAEKYIEIGNAIGKKVGIIENTFRYYDATGQVLMNQGKYQEALIDFSKANEYVNRVRKITTGNSWINLYIARCYQKTDNLIESNKYAKKAYDLVSLRDDGDSKEIRFQLNLLLSENYEKSGKIQEAYRYLKEYQKLKYFFEEQNKNNYLTDLELQAIVTKSEQEKNRLEQARLLKEKENQNQRWWLFSIAAALLSALILTVILYRNNRHKQKANTLLHRQKEEIDYQRSKAEQALTDLKATQTQLIQKEKLASLGELTAGIAHEIQNPLNFVNNFAEVSTELIDELKEGPFQKLPDDEKEYAQEILGDLTSNLKKINHHGGRASSIVKGMLEHSRTESGEKRPTDLNTLADEYLKIAYHGFKAKNQSFNCELITDFDADLKPVDVAPQEIGRVLLNLYNNAFYAVSERAKLHPEDYQPMVQVSTQQIGHGIEFRVSDNGTGIPETVKAKIFQPFFTTKPTGEGTGLGLSLSYDIITKGHGGTLTVESTEGEGTEFIITLPTTV
ncbi:histidine kinase [Spirosoma sp. HMF4905]|uniref:histidine kinase n=2 Tax=Spirosoma arboris TaxID=2682092 RepID=A0A7K1S5E1_9BACT|nr:histidine kinase [Spirosoma arboris]